MGLGWPHACLQLTFHCTGRYTYIRRQTPSHQLETRVFLAPVAEWYTRQVEGLCQ